jgi:hypothetical protein
MIGAALGHRHIMIERIAVRLGTLAKVARLEIGAAAA